MELMLTWSDRRDCSQSLTWCLSTIPQEHIRFPGVSLFCRRDGGQTREKCDTYPSRKRQEMEIMAWWCHNLYSSQSMRTVVLRTVMWDVAHMVEMKVACIFWSGSLQWRNDLQYVGINRETRSKQILNKYTGKVGTIHLAEGGSNFGCCEHGNDFLDSVAGMEYLFASQRGLWSVWDCWLCYPGRYRPRI